MIKVEIDAHSGFCGGVIRAVSTAERFLSEGGVRLYSLGSIVHNEEEQSRLCGLGLVSIDKEDLDTMPDMTGQSLLIRAHGEPPVVYDMVRALGFKVIDCTCPVVLKLQKDIKNAYESVGNKGKIIIFGKVGHPEVLGLVGQTDGHALVVEDIEQLDAMLASGDWDDCIRIELFSQTTKSPVEYAHLVSRLKYKYGDRVVVHDTICSQVASRHDELSTFARSHDVIVFVSGKSSSNGKVLCDLCSKANFRTYHVSSIEEIQSVWFRPDDKVGVCGATSTPRWLLEKVAALIENLQ